MISMIFLAFVAMASAFSPTADVALAYRVATEAKSPMMMAKVASKKVARGGKGKAAPKKFAAPSGDWNKLKQAFALGLVGGGQGNVARPGGSPEEVDMPF